MSKIAGRAAIQGMSRKTVDVELDGLTYRLREMSGTQRDRFESAAVVEKAEEVDGKREIRRVVDPMYLRARLVAMCWVDEDGTQCYADDEVHMLSDDIPASKLNVLFEAAQKLNGLDADAVKVAEKN